jgi:hypothetical protein
MADREARINVDGPSIGTLGQAAKTNATKQSATRLLQSYFKVRTVDKVLSPLFLENPDHHKQIATQSEMEYFAGFCSITKYGAQQKYYAHGTIEVYFNAAIIIVEDTCKMKFDFDWKKKTCENLVRIIIRREVDAGDEVNVKVSAGRKLTSLISKQFFKNCTGSNVDDIEIRSSVVLEFKACGRLEFG